ncbi:MAG: class A beta-lactamase [Burkholderiaceae bacterium]|nr:class A beta-lactamase [Burkholderiaceae bacterium]
MTGRYAVARLLKTYAVAAACVLSFVTAPAVSIAQALPLPESVLQQVQAVESRLGARVGVALVDVASARHWAWRGHERFPLNSTFKAFACAALLARVDAAGSSLARTTTISKADIVSYSPVFESQIGHSVTLAQLCEAAVTMSDNAAANLILKNIDGPEGFTRFMRSLGDDASRLDRFEPELNEATPGDLRDTTTPAAIVHAVLRLVEGDALTVASKARLVRWMRDNRVAGPVLRAVLPEGWQIADRTGAGGYGSRSIVAVVWPSDGTPWGIAIYLTQSRADMAERNRAIGDIGRAAFDFIRSDAR